MTSQTCLDCLYVLLRGKIDDVVYGVVAVVVVVAAVVSVVVVDDIVTD